MTLALATKIYNYNCKLIKGKLLLRKLFVCRHHYCSCDMLVSSAIIFIHWLCPLGAIYKWCGSYCFWLKYPELCKENRAHDKTVIWFSDHKIMNWFIENY